MKIEILKIRFPKGNKVTKAFIDIIFDEIKVRDFRVMQNNGKAYVREPFTTYKNENGELQFRQIIEFSKEVQGRVFNEILNAFYRETEKINEQTQAK